MNKKSSKFSPEIQEHTVRLAREQRSEYPPMRQAIAGDSLDPVP